MTKKEIAVVLVLVLALIPCGAAFKLDFGGKARMNKSLQHAKQIALALRVYAGDEDGNYPGGEDANEAYANLVRELGTEKIFYVEGSAWHGTGLPKRAATTGGRSRGRRAWRWMQERTPWLTMSG